MIEAVEVVIRQPGHPDRVVRLQEGATRIGRAEDNELMLSDVGVSRRHAQIFVSKTEVTVEDLGSGNGTYYNGYRIQSQALKGGDEVVIDPFVLQFVVVGSVRGGPSAPSPAAEPVPARLEVVVGTGMAGSSYPIASRGLSIGRSEDRDVVLPDPAASRHHCSILLQGEAYVLRDMGSANGVYVNAVRVRDCTLSDGDMIRIGNTEMRFVRSNQKGTDTTTQVVAHEVWNPGAGGPTPLPQRPPSLLREPSPPARSRTAGGIIGIVLAVVVSIGALGAIVLTAVVVLALLMWSADEAIPQIEAQPPRWTLTLPSGLPAATAGDLFDAGVAKMRDGDRKGALQDFYRVIQADPRHPSAERFAFAAGELLTLDTLQKRLDTAVAARKQREAQRDALLRDAKRGDKVGRQAQLDLEARFREDPVVIDAMGWSKTEGMLALEAQARDAAELLAELNYAEAAARYRTVLDGATDPTLRKTAAASLMVCQRERAREKAETWRKAVMSEATGDRAAARAAFQELASSDPTNVSYRLHLDRSK